MGQGLPRGPLSERTVHLCVDMQRMFRDETAWHTPWMERVIPVVASITAEHPAATVFTRFIPPERAEDMEGGWRTFYERWREFTRARIDPALLELVEPLGDFAPPARILDKPGFSPFHRTDLAGWLRQEAVDTVVITGAETDMCVLAAVLDAIDFGLRVVIPTDALCSSSDAMHDALLQLYSGRFSMQIETAETATVLANWN
jgi:nicotinamidase-related amidase